MKALFKAVVLIGLGGGAQILAHELSGFPTVPEILGPFSGKLEGPLGPSLSLWTWKGWGSWRHCYRVQRVPLYASPT